MKLPPGHEGPETEVDTFILRYLAETFRSYFAEVADWGPDPCDPDATDGDLCKSCLAGRHDRDRIEEDL